MANGFSVLESLNKSSKAAVDDSPKARFRTKDIQLSKIYRNKNNFYEVSGIRELANEIMLVGLLENLTVRYAPCEKGDYEIIGGERRYCALNLLVEEGHKEFEVVTCQIREIANSQQEEIEMIIANSYRDKSIKDILEEERRLKSNLEYMKEHNIAIKGYDLSKGRLRDIVSSMLGMSRTKVAQIESINNNLMPEFRKELEEGRLKFSTAHMLAGMPEEQQQELYTVYGDTGSLTVKEVQQMKESAAAVPEEEQVEGQYEIQDYPEYCPKAYLKPEIEKTPEQLYDEEQAKIDKKVQQALKDREYEEKMQQLPSERPKEQKRHMKRIGASEWNDLYTGKKKFYVLKDEGQQEGERICFTEFKDGKATGRTMEFVIEYAQREHSGIEEEYCILGIKLAQQ